MRDRQSVLATTMLLTVAMLLRAVDAHAQLTLPTSNRVGGSIAAGGNCKPADGAH